MKPIKDINPALIVTLFTVGFLGAPVSAHAVWSDAGMCPMVVPSLNPNQGQAVQREAHINVAPPQRIELQEHVQPPQRVEPQRHVQPPAPIVHNPVPVVNRPQAPRVKPPVNHNPPVERREPDRANYSHYSAGFYTHYNDDFPYRVVMAPAIVLPDTFEAIVVNGQIFYYHQGAFYQMTGGQLMAIPAVLGAVVDSIPEDYQIVMADGVNYCIWGGTYYERVAEGFQVVEPPIPLES